MRDKGGNPPAAREPLTPDKPDSLCMVIYPSVFPRWSAVDDFRFTNRETEAGEMNYPVSQEFNFKL